MSLVLVDTNVFIDFFKKKSIKNQDLIKLIDNSNVLLSSYVKLELLLGVRKEERVRLEEILSPLPIFHSDRKLFDVAYSLVPIARRYAFNPGSVDFLIAIQALVSRSKLWTEDKMLQKLAKVLEIDLYV